MNFSMKHFSSKFDQFDHIHWRNPQRKTSFFVQCYCDFLCSELCVFFEINLGWYETSESSCCLLLLTIVIPCSQNHVILQRCRHQNLSNLFGLRWPLLLILIWKFGDYSLHLKKSYSVFLKSFDFTMMKSWASFKIEAANMLQVTKN